MVLYCKCLAVAAVQLSQTSFTWASSLMLAIWPQQYRPQCKLAGLLSINVIDRSAGSDTLQSEHFRHLFVGTRPMANICTLFSSVDTWVETDTPYTTHCVSTYVLFTFLASLWGNKTLNKIKTAEKNISYWGEVEKSKSDSSYTKKRWLLKLSCSVTYHQLDYYLVQEDCNKLSDFLLSWNDGMEIVLCIFG